MEHRRHPLMQPVLHPAVHVPQAQGALVQGILGQLLLRDVEHLGQGGVILEVPYCPVFRIWIYGPGDDLHHGQLGLQAVEAVGEQELHQAQAVGRGAADDLGADDTRLMVRHLAQADGHDVAAVRLKGLLQTAVGYLRRGLRMEVEPASIELHSIIIDGGIFAHPAAARRYHLLQQPAELLASGLRVAWQLTKVHDSTLADLTLRIAPVLRETEVVVLLYRPVRTFPVVWSLADEHGGKGSDFFRDHQTPGGPTGGGKRYELPIMLALFSRSRGENGLTRQDNACFLAIFQKCIYTLAAMWGKCRCNKLQAKGLLRTCIHTSFATQSVRTCTRTVSTWPRYHAISDTRA